MAMQLGALRNALLNPGNPELAEKAAEEVAGYETRLASIDARLHLLTWMVGATFAVLSALGFGNLWLLFNLLGRR